MKHQTKIRTRLLTAFLALSIPPFALIGVIALVNSNQAVSSLAFGQLRSVREVKKAQIEEYFAGQRKDMNFLVETVSHLQKNAFTKTDEDFFTRYTRGYGFGDLLILSPEGRVFYSVEHESDYGEDVRRGPLADSGLGLVFEKVMSSGSFSFVDFSDYAPCGGKPFAFIGLPVTQGGATELVVVLRMPQGILDKMLAVNPHMGQSGEVYLVGEDHFLRACSKYGAGCHGNRQKIDTPAVREALAGKTDEKIITDYRGIRVLSAYTPIHVWDTTWALAAEIDKEEAFAHFRVMKLLGSMVALISTAVIFAFSFFMARRFSLPILHLAGAAEKVKSRNFDISVRVSGNDELRILGDAFNDMVVEIRNYAEELEQKVRQLQIAEADLRKSDAFLRQAQKMEALGTLAGGIAHDFNNVLAAILGYTEMTRDELPEDSRGRKNCDEVIRACLRARNLVKRILVFSRKSESVSTPINLSTLVRETLDLLRASIPTTIEIRRKIDEGAGVIMGDSTRIHQVIMNISTNAAQAMEETGGILSIGVDSVRLGEQDMMEDPGMKPGEYVRLSIKDTGMGIDPCIKTRIFDPYFTTKPVGKGSGMGLAVVHGIIKSHKGKIEVESRPGEGTAFHVYFPKAAVEPKDPEQEESLLPTGKERILVVDDETVITDITKHRLERLGYKVTTKNDGKQALEWFADNPFSVDLILTDQTMPGMTGDRLAAAAMEIRPGIPVILCTGYSSKIDMEQASAMGIRAFLMKPIEKSELATVIRDLLDR